jgi:hypothetical protein
MITRNSNGFSLVPVIAIGVIAAMWLLGMTALVMPSYQKVCKTKKVNILRSASETSLDWAVSQLNLKNAALEPPINGYSKTDVPPSVIDSAGAFTTTTPPHSTVYVFDQAPPSTMTNPPAQYTSYVYDPYFDPNTTHPSIKPTVNRNGWRRVVARSTWGDPSVPDNVKTVQVILKPNYVPGQAVPGNPLPPKPYFEFGLFGGQSVGLNGNQTVDAFDSRNGNYGGGNVLHDDADVGTNGGVSISGNSTIFGDLVVSNKLTNPNSSTDAGYLIQNASASGDVHVTGKLINNGLVSGFNSGNVDGGITSGYRGGDYTPVKELPPTPQPPGSATPLGDISLSGNQTLTLTAGDYTASSINISGNGKLKINSSAGPVNIYMVGSGNISISGNGVSNLSGKPSNFRLWNGSSAPTTISGNGDLIGVVYAPNSPIKISGNGQVYGAVVGHSVTLSGGGTSGGFHYDIALRSVDTGLTYQPPPPPTTPLSTMTNLQTVSWQEVDWNMALP